MATLLFSISRGYAQKELNLEDIWKNNAFGSRYVSGIQSLNDGLHYTTLVNSGKTQYIIKYQYKNGNAVDTIFNTAKAVGLNVELLKKDMAAPDVADQLLANMNLARALKVSVVPGYFVDTRILSGASSRTQTSKIDFAAEVATVRAGR